MQATSIGLAAAPSLLNIGHALKAIKLCKESLVLLNNKALSIEKQVEQFSSVRFSRTLSLFPIARDPKLTAEALGFRWIALKKFCARQFRSHLAQIYRPSQTLYKLAEG